MSRDREDRPTRAEAAREAPFGSPLARSRVDVDPADFAPRVPTDEQRAREDRLDDRDRAIERGR